MSFAYVAFQDHGRARGRQGKLLGRTRWGNCAVRGPFCEDVPANLRRINVFEASCRTLGGDSSKSTAVSALAEVGGVFGCEGSGFALPLVGGALVDAEKAAEDFAGEFGGQLDEGGGACGARGDADGS